MQEQGRVIKTEGNLAFIELEKRAACGYCHACDMKDTGNVLKIVNDRQAKQGDRVVLSIPEWNMVKIAILVYIVPLIIFVSAYLLGDGLARNFSDNTDQFILWGIAIAAGALGIYYLLMKLYDRRYRNNLKNKPRIEKIL